MARCYANGVAIATTLFCTIWKMAPKLTPKNEVDTTTHYGVMVHFSCI